MDKLNYLETPFQKFATFGKVKQIDNQYITRTNYPLSILLNNFVLVLLQR
jgi:hypothetical protein